MKLQLECKYKGKVVMKIILKRSKNKIKTFGTNKNVKIKITIQDNRRQ